MRGKLLAALFGLATAGSLGFGGSQAFATPAASACDQFPWQFTLSCPAPRTCDDECAGRGYFDGGLCRNNCCTCAI